MTNDLTSTTKGNADENLPDHIGRMQDLINGVTNISNSIAEAGGVASGLPFIGINSEGIWAYGQDRTEVEPDSHWAVDIRSWKHGYIAWPPATVKERKPLGERMVPANMMLPRIADLPDVGAPYTLQFSFELLCLDGEDAGVMALYKNGSYGAKVIVQTLAEEVRKQAKRDPSRLCPVVKLGIRSYYHQEWRKNIHNPVLEIRQWITFEDFDSFEEESAEDIAQAENENRLQAAVSPAPQPQPQRAAAPQSNGRRAAPAPEPAPMPTGRRRSAVAPEPAPTPEPAPMPTGRRRPVRQQPTA